MKRGSIDFDFPEYKIILDTEGNPLRLEKRERSIAEQMVEESMLIANETVAAYLRNSENPSVYRIHAVPEQERIETLRTVLTSFDLPIPQTDDIVPRDFQKLLDAAKGTDAELVVQTITLRSMQQACYSTANCGHFGLASECYTHFTSPIRRYPDLMVHRLIRKFQERGRLTQKEAEQSLSYHTMAANQASTRERVAVEAERETDDLKKAEYMVPFIGEPFDAHVSGITPFGLFVSLENGIEGLIHISFLTDDTYEFNEATYTMVGQQGGKIYHLGDPIRVTLAQVNVEKCEIDFVPGTIESLADLQQMMMNRTKSRQKRSGSHTDNKRNWMTDAKKNRKGKNIMKKKKIKKNKKIKKIKNKKDSKKKR